MIPRRDTPPVVTLPGGATAVVAPPTATAPATIAASVAGIERDAMAVQVSEELATFVFGRAPGPRAAALLRGAAWEPVRVHLREKWIGPVVTLLALWRGV